MNILNGIIGSRNLSALPYVLTGTVIIAILFFIIIVYIVLSSRKKDFKNPAASSGEKEEKEEIRASKDDLSSLKNSFRAARKVLRRNASGRDYLYRTPWFVIVGKAGSGKTSLLDKSGIDLSFGDFLEHDTEAKEKCTWWFFEQGVILDIAGASFLEENRERRDNRFWDLFLDLLRKNRPGKPIDGVILTIPCSDLLPGRDPGSPVLRRKAQEEAEIIRKRLRDVQKTLCVRFPIYILVTQCDQIPGFKSFCQGLPDHLTDSIFGWSSPYSVDTAYLDKWTPEIFDNVVREIFRTKLEIFANTETDPNELILFSEIFQSLSDLTGIYLDCLFRDSAYYKSFIFRGIYFCGSPESGNQIRPFFVRSLFERKIIPEYGLAGPTREIFFAEKKRVRILKGISAVIAIFLVVGLWLGYADIKGSKNAFLPVLQEIEDNLDKLNAIENSQDSFVNRKDRMLNYTDRMLKNMAGTKIVDFKSFFIPSSWGSEVDGKVISSLAIAYEKIVSDTIYMMLYDRIKSVVNPGTGHFPVTDAGVSVMLDQTPEFKTLNGFLSDLTKIEENIGYYNTLAEHGLQEIKGGTEYRIEMVNIAKYLFGIELNPSFRKYYRFYREALAEIALTFIDMEEFRVPASEKADYLVEEFYETIFVSGNKVLISLDRLSQEIEIFFSQYHNAIDDPKALSRLYRSLSEAESIIGAPENAWMFATAFNPGEFFKSIISLTETSSLLGPEKSRKIIQDGNKRLQDLQNDLKNKRTSLTGRLIALDDKLNITNRLSQVLLVVKAGIEKFRKTDIRKIETYKNVDFVIPPSSKFTWDIWILKKIVASLQEYENFIEKTEFPKNFKKIIDKAAEKRLEQDILSSLSKALQFAPLSGEYESRQLRESELNSDIKNFTASSQYLTDIMDYCNKMNLVNIKEVITGLTAWQTGTLLKTAYYILKSEGLYTPMYGDLSWWDGMGRISLKAFHVIDDKELEHYLSLQFSRINHLAGNCASAVVAFIKETGIKLDQKGEQVLFRWEQILSDIDDSKNKKPGNPVDVLEKFILFEMDYINADNYFDKIDQKELEESSSDFFLQKRHRLQKMIYTQAEQNAVEAGGKAYIRLSSFFNKNLGGRFPFSAITEKAEADPETIRNFYRLFDRDKPVLNNILKRNKGLGISSAEVFDFIDQMERVRDVFASYLDTKEEKRPLTFDFDVEFRVNKKFESGANRIIEWRLKTENQVFTNSSPEKRGHWVLGDPVSISFRWAKDSAYYPVSRTSPDKERMTYRFNTPWAFIRLLKTYEDLSVVDPVPHILKFSIKTKMDSDKSSENFFWTTLFVRISLLAPDENKDKSINIPFFPVHAPDLK